MSIFKNRTVIGVICILLALVICFGITPLFNQSISQKAEIVRVTKDIHAGELITKDMVTTTEVGSYNLPSGILREKDNVVGKYAKADLAVGDYILAAKLSDAPAAENAYLYNLDGTKQAISVTIKSFATGLSGKLQSGDIVHWYDLKPIRQEPNCPLWLALFVKHNCCLDQYCEVPSNIKLHASPSIHRLEMPLEIALKNS